MKKIYLDNAATTQVRAEVIAEMMRILADDFGNPSSSHSFGRISRNTIELSRKAIAAQLHAHAGEIIFTSGATEANNWIIRNAVVNLKVERIITSKIEHHAVLHAVERMGQEYGVIVDYVKILPDGGIDMAHLESLLSQDKPTLVSLMHVNNETGVITDIEAVAKMAKLYGAYFHSDTVQSVGKLRIDVQQFPIDFLVASAHKFHGPKGIGFAYIRKGLAINPVFFGGEQEKGLRPGTESVHNIAGMAKALELSYAQLESDESHIRSVKQYAFDQLSGRFPEMKVNGNADFTLYNILNVLLPFSPEKTSMILFNLDMKGIAVSRGSACQSGSPKPSHVLAEMLGGSDLEKPSLRISFSHYNSQDDIDELVKALMMI
ncbi:cysteine desulfurase family protein [Flavobacterium pallidum]|uniref:cysteine desulfurase n=1 Tax=Flavobacterium pallidum TaxID=2172098 RepID=A0A2S1SJI3_9FLAO|nr:cysteine desulfurase family protein [Flavobacterium pallidum]AWI26570.1 cysteine desulfurase [Flavobacterium pallidum]